MIAAIFVLLGLGVVLGGVLGVASKWLAVEQKVTLETDAVQARALGRARDPLLIFGIRSRARLSPRTEIDLSVCNATQRSILEALRPGSHMLPDDIVRDTGLAAGGHPLRLGLPAPQPGPDGHSAVAVSSGPASAAVSVYSASHAADRGGSRPSVSG